MGVLFCLHFPWDAFYFTHPHQGPLIKIWNVACMSSFSFLPLVLCFRSFPCFWYLSWVSICFLTSARGSKEFPRMYFNSNHIPVAIVVVPRMLPNTCILPLCLLWSLSSLIRATLNLDIPFPHQHPNPEVVVDEVQRRLNASLSGR